MKKILILIGLVVIIGCSRSVIKKPADILVSGPVSLNTVLFAYDSAEIVDYEALDENLDSMSDKVWVMGHADARGGYDYNMELSMARADAVINYYKSKGYEGLLIPEPCGERIPTGNGYDFDRRVETVVIK